MWKKSIVQKCAIGLFGLTLLVLFSGSNLVHAEEPSTPTAPLSKGHNFSVTFSPIHLVMPLLEVTTEFAVTPKMGAALIVGLGRIESEPYYRIGGEEATDTYTAIEVGGQYRFYVLGDFNHGMQVGIEALYIHLSGKQEDTQISGTASGLAIGPFVGYKIATRLGFTFDGQLGVQYALAQGEATDGDSGASASAEDSNTLLLLNLNVGWSF